MAELGSRDFCISEAGGRATFFNLAACQIAAGAPVADFGCKSGGGNLAVLALVFFEHLGIMGNSLFYRLVAGMIHGFAVALGVCLLIGRWIKGARDHLIRRYMAGKSSGVRTHCLSGRVALVFANPQVQAVRRDLFVEYRLPPATIGYGRLDYKPLSTARWR